MTTDLFATAVTTEAPKAPKTKKTAKKQIELQDLGALTALNAISKALEGIKTTLEASVKGQAMEHFVEIGMARGARPDNFEGIDEYATASVELRKRSTASVLTMDEKTLLEANGVEVVEEIKTAAVPELFYFNQEVLTDPIKRAAINKALGAVPELEGTQVIMRQQAEAATVKYVVSDASIDKAFQAGKSAELVAQLVKMTTVIALKTKMSTSDLKVALAILEKAGLSLS